MEISEYLEAKTVVSVSCCAFPLYEQRDDELIIDVCADITIIRPSTIDLERRVPIVESFSRSRQALLASDHDGVLLSSILTEDIELPFDWTKQTLVWEFAKEETSMEGITARLSRAARGIVIGNNNNKNNGGEMMMVIFVRRFVNLTMDEKKMLLDLNVIIEGGQNPLSDWIAKNRKDLLLNLQDDSSTSSSYYARRALSKLYQKDKMFLGLKSVKMTVEEEEDEEEEAASPCCAICLKGFRHDEIGIGMPCSHVFHGFCILAWISRRETCPLCPFDLLD